MNSDPINPQLAKEVANAQAQEAAMQLQRDAAAQAAANAEIERQAVEMQRTAALQTAAERAAQRDLATTLAAQQALHRQAAENQAIDARIASGQARATAAQLATERSVLRDNLERERASAASANTGLMILSGVVLAALLGFGLWYVNSQNSAPANASAVNTGNTAMVQPASAQTTTTTSATPAIASSRSYAPTQVTPADSTPSRPYNVSSSTHTTTTTRHTTTTHTTQKAKPAAAPADTEDRAVNNDNNIDETNADLVGKSDSRAEKNSEPDGTSEDATRSTSDNSDSSGTDKAPKDAGSGSDSTSQP